MSTNITGARIINKVVYDSDRASLRRVRKELQALKNLSAKQSVDSAKAEIKAAKDAANAQIAQTKRVIQFHQQQERKGKGTGMVGTAAMYDPAKVARQTAQMNNLAQKSVSERMRQQERQQKAAAKQRKDALDRDINGIMGLRKTAFDINRLQGLDIGKRYEAIQQARKLADEYKRGNLEIGEMREGLRQVKVLTSATAREARKMAKRDGRPTKKGNSNWLTSGAAFGGFVPALSLAGATYGAIHTTRSNLSDSIDRQAGRRMQKSMGLDPLEGQALQQAIFQQTGQNFSADKLSNISKDVQDKVGQLSQGQWKQNKKDGTWNFSGGGELSDWLNIMTTRGGYGRDEAVQTLRNAKGPVEFALILENLKKQAKLTDTEFTALSESVDDLSYVTKSIGPEAENVTKNLNEIARSGLALTDQQQKYIESLSELSTKTRMVSENLSDNFSASFAKGLSDAGLTAGKLTDDLLELRPIVKTLGHEFGELTANILSLLRHIPGTQSYNRQAYSDAQANQKWASKQNDPVVSWLVERWSSTSTAGAQGWNDAVQQNRDGNQNNMFTNIKSDWMSQATQGNPFAMQLPNLQLSMAGNVNVNVNAGELTSLFNAEMDSRITNSWDAATFDLNQSNSYN
ncbi:hypothetical protein [Erwinia mallotivora]|uniref:Uncharacterized protein n=1 Tax=Erwinia mallotivora TaxID=69222 RepID=A0A014M718_9GAMM|nr:hypothetical protein [Erwinia mallotivora]EXU73884.1 hypothetical protein BG55_20485 [Erwinia mallotivora]